MTQGRMFFLVFLLSGVLGEERAVFLQAADNRTRGYIDSSVLCCQEPNLEVCGKAQINSDLLTVLNEHRRVSLPDEIKVDFVSDIYGEPNAWSYGSDGAYVIITFDPTSQSFYIHAQVYGVATYGLEYCGTDGHVWKKYGQINDLGDKVYEGPSCGTKTTRTNRPNHANLVAQGEDLANTDVAEYTVKIYYTTDFANTFPDPTTRVDDIKIFVKNMLLIANAGYEQSSVRLKVKQHGKLEQLDIKESDDPGSEDFILGRFMKSKGDNCNDNYKLVRLRDGADAASLLVSDSSQIGLCGIANQDGILDGNTASIVAKNCVDEYTFGHELGHNFGIHHNKEQDVNNVHQDGHGYWVKDSNINKPGIRTIMAYQDPATPPQYPTVVNYYSNKNLFTWFTGARLKMGADHADNAAVLNRMRFSFAAIGKCSPPPPPPPPPPGPPPGVAPGPPPPPPPPGPPPGVAPGSPPPPLRIVHAQMKSQEEDEDACRQKCDSTEGCKNWAFKKNTSDQQKKGLCKLDIITEVSYCPDQQLKKKKIQTENEAGCKTACENDPECKYWEWEKKKNREECTIFYVTITESGPWTYGAMSCPDT